MWFEDDVELDDVELDDVELDVDEPGFVVVVAPSSHFSVFGSHFGSDPDAPGTNVSMAATSAMAVTRPTTPRLRARTRYMFPPNLCPRGADQGL